MQIILETVLRLVVRGRLPYVGRDIIAGSDKGLPAGFMYRQSLGRYGTE